MKKLTSISYFYSKDFFYWNMNHRRKFTYCMYLLKSMNITIIAFNLMTFLRKTCRLNLISGSMNFFSLGFNVLAQARNMFQTTVISSNICGLLPLARHRNFLSFKAYQRFSPLRIFNKGIATLPKNSTLWSRSSSYTVTSKTEFMSFTLLIRNKKLILFFSIKHINFTLL